MNIPFTQHTLENGLRVIIHEDRRLPMVAVNLWYHVGSKNEHPGRTGFAHLFEHLMFEGSQHYDKGYFHPLQEAGAALNGSTNPDRTNYWEVVPTNALDLALWMESDRMGYLLPALTMQKFETQREVVLNERRQNYENRPYGLATMAIVAALFPSNHPVPLDDDRRDRRSEGRDVRRRARVFQDLLPPVECVAGRRRRRRHGRCARARAGSISTRFRRAEAGAARAGGRDHRPSGGCCSRIASSCRACISSWHSPAMFTDGDAEMDLLSDLFANGKVSRLYKALVYERRIASEVMAFQNSRELAGFWQVVATAAPGHTLDELQQAIDDELARLTDDGPTEDEMRARARADRGAVRLPAADARRLRRQGRSAQRLQRVPERSRLLRARSGAVCRASRSRICTARSRKYLRTDNRVVLSVVPKGKLSLALPDSTPAVVS